MRDAGPTRRTVLAGFGALVAVGVGATACTSGDDDSGPDPEQRKADDAVRERARAAANALLDRYDAVAAAYPSLSGRLRPCSDAVGRHLTALGGTRTPPASLAPAEPVPPSEQAALADLAAREQQGSDGRLADLSAAGPELARLLASISACQYVHAKQLGSAS